MEPQKRKKLSGTQFRQQKREKEVQKEQMAGSLMIFLSKPENKEMECQEDIEVALISIALNQEAMAMDIIEDKDIRSSEGELSKTREGTTEEPLWNQLSTCQRSLIFCTVIVLFFLITSYILFGSESSVERIESQVDILEKKEDILDNSQNDHKVIEEPAAAEVDFINKQQQVLAAPKTEKKLFAGPTTIRQQAVVKAFQHAWKGYKQFAWGHDHLKPISGSYDDWFGLGLTIVDSLDTIYIMGLKEEYTEAREWVDKHLNFDINRDVNLFEVTIRVLGGLLSIYHFTKDDMFLNKATDLANRLLPCFESDSGIPFSDVNLFTRKTHVPKWSSDSSTSEVTTIQIEFKDLSRVTGDPKYENAADKVSMLVHKLPKKDGLVPIFINPNSGQFQSYATITLGARGDSYYEYLLKQWLQSGKTIDYLRDDFIDAIAGVEQHLVRKTQPNGLLFIGELTAGGKEFNPKMDHLTCYLPGTLALGVHNGLPESHLKLADELMQTCYKTYSVQPTFLAPEITYFNMARSSKDMNVKTNDAHNLLRPEFIESLWYMYQLTGNTTYQDWGWQIFQAFENYTKVVNGYTSINNVKNPQNVRPRDKMESFFLAETLKYLYLLFSDDPKLLDLDKYVINTEAHPLPIYDV